MPGFGVGTIVGFDNDVDLNADGTPRDGAILLVDGARSPARCRSRHVSVTSRYRVDRHADADRQRDRRHRLEPDAGSVARRLRVGQQVWVTGVDTARARSTSISGSTTLTLTGGADPDAGARRATVALVRIGGDDDHAHRPELHRHADDDGDDDHAHRRRLVDRPTASRSASR